MALTQVDQGLLGTYAQYTGFKNRIINGAMMIDQRNNGASVTATGANNVYTLDRWNAVYSVGSKFTVQQNAGSVTPPVGYTNYLGATSSSSYSVPTNETYAIVQNIEGLNCSDLSWGNANAKTVTLSFWAYSSLTGTFGGSIRNSANNRSYPFSYSISTPTTWTYVSLVIPGDTTGTWLTTNGVGIQVCFSLGAGATYSGTPSSWSGNYYVSATGATSVVGTSGATFYITGVQLEKGSTATSFDYRPYGTELQLCQRYYIKFGSESADDTIGLGFGVSTTVGTTLIPFPVKMRTAPASSSASLKLGDSVNSPITVTGTTDDNTTSLVGRLSSTVASGLTQFRPYVLRTSSSTGYVAFSAEL